MNERFSNPRNPSQPNPTQPNTPLSPCPAATALLHELVVAVAFRSLRPWFFAAMVAQLPLIWLSRLVKSPRAGNAFVWLSLWLGQPLLELLYAREWVSRGHNAKAFFCLK